LVFGPTLDLRAEPELDPSRAEVEDRSGHVAVATLVLADRIAVGQAEDVGNSLGVE
jgi:hypothetical protein